MKLLGTSESIPTNILMQSLLVALFIDIKCMNQIIGAYGISEESSIMTFLYIFVVSSIIALAAFRRKRIMPGFTPQPIMVIAALLLVYCTSFFLAPPYTSTAHFFVFTLCAFTIPFYAEINVRLVLKSIMFYPILGITKVSLIFVFVKDWNEWISMGLSYAFLVPIAATIIYLFTYFAREKYLSKLITIGLSIVNFYYLALIFQLGSRGPIVIILVLLLLLFAFKLDEQKGFVIRKDRTVLAILICGLTIVFFDQFLGAIDAILQNYGISSHVVTKFINLSAEGDVAHERGGIFALAIDGFLNSPIWGNGFDQFQHNTGFVYPHNSILQILYDGGLILFSIIFIPVIKRGRQLIQSSDYNSLVLFILLFVIGFVGSMFSEDLWKQPLFWLFIGFILCDKMIYKNELYL